MEQDAIRAEIARNFDAFQRTVTDHLRAHAGQYALLKVGRVRGYFFSAGEADCEGWQSFPDHLYSIQQVTPEPVALGFYANAAD